MNPIYNFGEIVDDWTRLKGKIEGGVTESKKAKFINFEFEDGAKATIVIDKKGQAVYSTRKLLQEDYK